MENMYKKLAAISQRPRPFSKYSAAELWTDPHISGQMLKYHLDQSNDRASRRLTFIDASVAWLQNRFNIDNGTRIADFGCGPGLYATRLAALDAEVTGIDFSANSLEYARETAVSQNLPIEYIHSNYLEYSSDKQFDLILMISCDFCALSPAQRQLLLGIFANHLAEGGSILLDVLSMAEFEQYGEGTAYSQQMSNGFWADENHFVFENRFKYEPERVTLDKYTIFTPQREFEIYNWLQYYDKHTLAEEFASNRLTITAWYANVAGKPFNEKSSTIAIVAQKIYE